MIRSRAMAGLVGVMLVAAVPSQAMMQCIYYDEMVAGAPTVIQIDAPKIGPPDATGHCAVAGRVAQVFAGGLAVDDWVETSLACDNVQMEVGPVIWSDLAALQGAKVIELHLDQGGLPAGYGAGVVLLDTTSESPMWKPMCGE